MYCATVYIHKNKKSVPNSDLTQYALIIARMLLRLATVSVTVQGVRVIAEAVGYHLPTQGAYACATDAHDG